MLNMKEASQLLNAAGKKTILQSNVLREDAPPYENFYQVEEVDGKWVFGVFKIERENNPYLSKEKVFDTEEQAAVHFFLHRLSFLYFEQYVKPFMKKNENLDIGGPDFSKNELIQALNSLNIPRELLVTKHDQIKGKSVFLDEKDPAEAVVSILNGNGNVLHSTIPIPYQTALFMTFKKTYMLYLYETKVKELLKKEQVTAPISDEQMLVFLF